MTDDLGRRVHRPRPRRRRPGSAPCWTSTGTCLVVTSSSTTWIDARLEVEDRDAGIDGADRDADALTGWPSGLTLARSTVASKSSARRRPTSSGAMYRIWSRSRRSLVTTVPGGLVDGGDRHRTREHAAVLRGDEARVQQRGEGDGRELQRPVVDDEPDGPVDARAEAHRRATTAAVPEPSSSAIGPRAGPAGRATSTGPGVGRPTWRPRASRAGMPSCGPPASALRSPIARATTVAAPPPGGLPRGPAPRRGPAWSGSGTDRAHGRGAPGRDGG